MKEISHVSVRQEKEEAVKRIEQYLINAAEQARWVTLIMIKLAPIDDKKILRNKDRDGLKMISTFITLNSIGFVSIELGQVTW